MKKELKTDDLASMLQNITLIIKIKTEKKKENSETKLIFKK